jgi:hypothetical protein
MDDCKEFGIEVLWGWWGQSGDDPQEDLAKFGYKSKKLKTSFYIFGYRVCTSFLSL